MVDEGRMVRNFNRRTMVKSLGLGVAGLAVSRMGLAAGFVDGSTKPLRGLFPIAASPFTP